MERRMTDPRNDLNSKPRTMWQNIRPNILIGTLFTCLFLAILLPHPLFARYMRPDLEKIPVKDLVSTLAKKAKAEPENTELLTNLGRVYAMAYSQKTDEIQINKSSPGRAWFGYAPANVPFSFTKDTDDKEKKKQAAENLKLAISTFNKVVKLDKDNLVAQLSLAWCKDQLEEEEAVDLYRAIIKAAWEKEKDMQRAGLGWHSITAEAAGYLKTKLDKEQDSDEMSDLDDKIEHLGKIRRPMTPIAIGLRPGMSLDDIYSPNAEVKFDLDSSGMTKTWSWISKDAAWLVYDQKGDGKIESGLQLFGNSTFLCFWENGYHALAALDVNGDGVLRQSELTHLRLWRDINQNGISETGEVKTLDEYQIAEISCQYDDSINNPDLAAFNATGVTFAGGETRATYDVVLQEKAKTDRKRNAANSPKIAKSQRTAKQIELASKMFRLNTGRFPSCIDDLVTLPKTMTSRQWKGPYFPDTKVPTDEWNNPFLISIDETAIRIEVKSAGPDGLLGTDDDISTLPVKAKSEKVKGKDTDKLKIVFLAGKPSHGYASHEHYAGCMLLAKSLEDASDNIETEVYKYDWPKEENWFEGVDAIVMYCDGGKGHPVNKHLDEIDKLAAKGVGIVCIHYGVEVPKGESGKMFLKWIGGYFETDWSVNPHWTAKFEKIPDHDITRGVKPFSMNDEWYYHMRFRTEMKGVTPILSAIPPATTLSRPDGPHSGNPHVRKTAGKPQHVAWASENDGGGRGFGFTGGHFHWNWGDQNFRKLVLNAIVWTAKGEVPKNGMEDKSKTLNDLKDNQDYDPPKNYKFDGAKKILNNSSAKDKD